MNVGVLLAAGASSRMGSPKPSVKWKGMSFLAHGVRALWGACDTVVVVLGSNAKAVRKAAEDEFTALVETGALTEQVHATGREGSRGLEVHFTVNAGWRRGMLSSVQAGLAEALRLKPGAVIVLPVDHPEVKAETVAHLGATILDALGAFGARERAAFPYALVPRRKGMRGHPLALSPALARAVAHDRVARDLSDAVRRHARLVGYIDVADPGIARNRNTPKG
jgi:CTP:molybdopterin cytidylyltransferase MocA